MKTGYKVALYGVALAVVFGGTWAVGAAAGPAPKQESPMVHTESTPHNEHEAEPGRLPPGLSVSDNGYTLQLHEKESLGFHISGPDGKPVTRFAVEHEKRLHLIVVRRDGSNFRHVHPENGTGRHVVGAFAARRGGQLPGVRRLQAGGRTEDHARRRLPGRGRLPA